MLEDCLDIIDIHVPQLNRKTLLLLELDRKLRLSREFLEVWSNVFIDKLEKKEIFKYSKEGLEAEYEEIISFQKECYGLYLEKILICGQIKEILNSNIDELGKKLEESKQMPETQIIEDILPRAFRRQSKVRRYLGKEFTYIDNDDDFEPAQKQRKSKKLPSKMKRTPNKKQPYHAIPSSQRLPSVGTVSTDCQECYIID